MVLISEPDQTIQPAEGKLGILLVGNGAVSTTLIAGVELIKQGLAPVIGSQALIGTIRVGKRSDKNFPLIKDFVPLAELEDIVFGTWDPIADNSLVAARRAQVLPDSMIDPIAEQLSSINPMPAVFEQRWASRIQGTNIKATTNKMELVTQLEEDMRNFKLQHDCSRLIVLWSASTEKHMKASTVHATLESFEQGLRDNHEDISPSMIYAYAAIKNGIPYANGNPGLTVDIPALVALAQKHKVAICGKDFKTGQTLLKTGIAPIFKARLLKLKGWFSTNILGNRDGEVLDDPENFKSKEESKGSVLDTILPADVYPTLYKGYHHKIRIEYYPPRGDQKEGWDNIDIEGWLGMPMQIKINFLCRDSILAAPVALDIALFLDLAQRAGQNGIIEALSIFFKAPQTVPGLYPENDLFIQLMKFKNWLRRMKRVDLITHYGEEDYE